MWTLWSLNLHRHQQNNRIMQRGNRVLKHLWIGRISLRDIIISSSTRCSLSSIQMRCTSNTTSKIQVPHELALVQLKGLMSINILTAIKKVNQVVAGWATRLCSLILLNTPTKIRKVEISSREKLVNLNSVNLFAKSLKISILNKYITRLKEVLRPVKKLKVHLALPSLLMELLFKIRLKLQ
jgi:hypothetical protein